MDANIFRAPGDFICILANYSDSNSLNGCKNISVQNSTVL